QKNSGKLDKHKSHPLYTLFENILTNSTSESADLPAIWHVPDPIQLFQCPAGQSGSHSLDKSSSSAIRSISFKDLNTFANRVAVTLSTVIRKSTFWGFTEQINEPESGGCQPTASQSEAILALFMPPGIDRIVAQLACMKLHLAYLPLDRQLSIGRILQILEVIPSVMVIVARDYHERLFNEAAVVSDQTCDLRKQGEAFLTRKVESLRRAFRKISTVIWEDLVHQSRECPVYTNGVRNTSDQQIKNSRPPLGIPRSMCLFPDSSNPVVIVLFTSGSSTSGQKMVRLRQSQLYNRLYWQWSSNVEWDSNRQWIYRPFEPKVESLEVSLASTACVFVDAFTEMFSALFSGIPVIVPGGSECASEACVSDVRILAKLVEVFGITRITTVPVQLSIWMNQFRLIPSTDRAREFCTLRTVVVSGDILLPKLAHKFFQLFSEHPIRLLNFYGTTELAGDITAAVFHGEQDVLEATRHVDAKDQAESLLEGAPFVAVGKPVANTTIYIVRRRVSGNRDKDSGQRHNSGSLTMVVSENTDPSHIPNLSILGDGEIPQIDWEAEGYGVCEKGCVGEIAVSGLAAFENSPKLFDLTNGRNENTAQNKDELNGTHFERDQSPCINFPGDLGFICPKDGLVYVCGRSDELVKINAVGFLAGDVDRLIDQMKQSSAKYPHQMSTTEIKLPRIRQTVTIPIRHPVSKIKRLVCFYTSEEPNLLSSNQTIENFEIPRDLNQSIDLNVVEVDCAYGGPELHGPSPIELSAIIANYLPVYIRPIFVHINHIPVMSTSGKIDKQRLRTFYENSITCAPKSADIHRSLPRAPTATAKGPAQPPNLHLPDSSELTVHENLGLGMDRIEQARMVLASVLGLDNLGTSGEQTRPRDDEDFYILGGSSLLAVLALESLRQVGFKVYLETFYHTGNIGRILRSLRLQTETRCSDVSRAEQFFGDLGPSAIKTPMPFRETSVPFRNQVHKDQDILVREWDCDTSNTTNQSAHNFDEIVDLLVEAFDRKDLVARTFELSPEDLKLAASTYLSVKRHGLGIVLTASSEGGSSNAWWAVEDVGNGKKLIGAIISLPAERVPELPKNHKLCILQRYFQFSSDMRTSELDASKTLTVIMAGVVPPVTDSERGAVQSSHAKWKRITLEILTLMETELLKLAQERNYTHIETLNTSETTKEVCLELGYTILKTTRMQQFMEAENMKSDPKYYEHCCYHMVKIL
ncbi:AMP dependent ligase, partial [Fasciola gigantica]